MFVFSAVFANNSLVNINCGTFVTYIRQVNYYVGKNVFRGYTQLAYDVVATSHLGLIQVEMSRTMLSCLHDVATETDLFVTS